MRSVARLSNLRNFCSPRRTLSSSLGVVEVDSLLTGDSLPLLATTIQAAKGPRFDTRRFKGPTRAALFQSHVSVFSSDHNANGYTAKVQALQAVNQLNLERFLAGEDDSFTLDVDFFREVVRALSSAGKNVDRFVVLHGVKSFLLRKKRKQPFIEQALATCSLLDSFGRTQAEAAQVNRLLSSLCWSERLDEAVDLLVPDAGVRVDTAEESRRARFEVAEAGELNSVDILVKHYERLGNEQFLRRIVDDLVLPMVRRRGQFGRTHVHHSRFLKQLEVFKERAGESLTASLAELREVSMPSECLSEAELEHLISDQLAKLPLACVGHVPSSSTFMQSYFPWVFGSSTSKDALWSDEQRALLDPDRTVDWSILGKNGQECRSSDEDKSKKRTKKKKAAKQA